MLGTEWQIGSIQSLRQPSLGPQGSTLWPVGCLLQFQSQEANRNEKNAVREYSNGGNSSYLGQIAKRMKREKITNGQREGERDMEHKNKKVMKKDRIDKMLLYKKQ